MAVNFKKNIKEIQERINKFEYHNELVKKSSINFNYNFEDKKLDLFNDFFTTYLNEYGFIEDYSKFNAGSGLTLFL